MRKILLIAVFLLTLILIVSSCGSKAENEDYYESFDNSTYFKMGLIPAKKDGKWGYIDESLNFVIEPQFDLAEGFTADGLACVGMELEKYKYIYGYIDTKGEFVIEPSFYRADSFKEGCAYVCLNEGSEYYYINTKGEKSEPPVKSYENEPEKLIASSIKDVSGYTTRNGEIVIDRIYQDTTPFTEGLGAVKTDGKWGYINGRAEYVIEPQFDDARQFSEGLAAVCIDGEWGYINKKGKLVIDLAHDKAKMFSEGFAEVCTGKKWGFIDEKGEYYVEPVFDEVNPIYDGVSCVRLGSKWGYIDTGGNFFIIPKFDTAESFNSLGLALVSIDGKYGYIDREGNWVIELQYSQASAFNKYGYAQISYDPPDKCLNFPCICDFYLINTRGERMTKRVFDDYYCFGDGYILGCMRNGSKFELVSPDGEIIATEKDFEDIYGIVRYDV